ncbi:MAG: phosphate/phosphite/phosphonate ABC transporter substrate-binding protein [Proteobacteria bacterium]|nr:phosphate/phosphite/phosphonate ABC transporter substrate-binding protein [Pseudomonadota bacterium]
MKKTTVSMTIAAIFVLLAGIAIAAPKELLLCLPGFPGSQAQAQPFVDKMLRHLESKLKWQPFSLKGIYIPDGNVAVEKLRKERPEIALVGPSIYASEHKALGMKVIAKIEVNGRSEEIYSVITRKDGPSALDELVGKKVEGAVIKKEKYVYNVLFDQQLKAGQLILESQKRPLRSLRNVVRNKSDAAIVDQSVVDHLSELPFANEVQSIYTTKPVPSALVVVMGDGKKQAVKLKSMLVGMCKRPDGRELCQTLTISAIKSSSNLGCRKLLTRYNR